MPTQKLTDKGMKGLAAGADRIEYWDTVQPGLAVRVGTTGGKNFFVGVRIRGKYTRVTLKPAYPALTLAEARKQAGVIITDAQAGINPKTKKKRAEADTFGAVAEAFMLDFAKDHRTRGEMQRKIRADLASWHDVPIADITRGNIKELLREKAREAPISANRLKSLISKIFIWALKEELIGSSPAISLDPPGGDELARQRERCLTHDEIKSVWGAFDQMGYPYAPLFKMLLVTGQRRGEVAGMKWTELGEDGWHVPSERAKSGHGHLIHLSTLAREILDGVPRIGKYVFRAHHDAPLQGWSVAKRRLDSKAGIEPWHLHDLRRTFATNVRALGVDRLVVSKLLNHSEGGVTKIYDRYSADPEKAAALERWANRLREIITGAPADNVARFERRAGANV